jgi:hypothetical protein
VIEEPVTPPEQPAADAAPATSAPPKRRRTHPILRGLAILVAIVAAVIVSGLVIDLGPALKKRAEQAGSNYLERPMHIGRLGIHLGTGAFQVDDLVIEGLQPTDRPFLRAKRIFVYMPWWTAFTHELIVDHVDMTGWEMLVEQFPGKHNFPRVTPRPKQKKGEPIWKMTTTVRQVTARNGRFIYDDHTVPWKVVCNNLDVSVFKGRDTYRGTAQFSHGTVKIQNYEEFRADMQTRFRIDNGKVLLEDINLPSTGAQTHVNGYVDFRKWPDMLYNVRSHIDFPTQKDIYFKTMNFTVTGQGDFTGTFRFFKTATGTGRELKGTFTSPEAGVNAWRFPDARGAVLWNNTAFNVTDVTTGLYGGRAKFDYLMEPLGKPGFPTQVVWDAQYADVDLTRLTDFLELQGIRLAGRATGRNRLEWPLGKFALKHGTGEVTAVMPAGSLPLP